MMIPDDATKLDMVHHIVHDWAKLVHIFTAAHPHPPPLNHAVERAFLVEARKFANFFKNKRGPRGNDAISADFVSNTFTPLLPVWDAWHDHINVHLTHLSYERVSNAVSWTGEANEPIFDEMCKRWDDFIQCVDVEYRPTFDTEIKKQL